MIYRILIICFKNYCNYCIVSNFDNLVWRLLYLINIFVTYIENYCIISLFYCQGNVKIQSNLSYISWNKEYRDLYLVMCTFPTMSTGCFRRKLTLEMLHVWLNHFWYMRFPWIIFIFPKNSGQPGYFEYNYFAQLLILGKLCIYQSLQ